MDATRRWAMSESFPVSGYWLPQVTSVALTDRYLTGSFHTDSTASIALLDIISAIKATGIAILQLQGLWFGHRLGLLPVFNFAFVIMFICQKQPCISWQEVWIPNYIVSCGQLLVNHFILERVMVLPKLILKAGCKTGLYPEWDTFLLNSTMHTFKHLANIQRHIFYIL